MKERSFLKQLGKLKGKLKVCRYGGIRTKGRYILTGYNRSNARYKMCPIEAVYREIKGENVSYLKASSVLKIDNRLETQIIDAADNSRPLIKENAKLRKKMLDVLGLKEKE